MSIIEKEISLGSRSEGLLGHADVFLPDESLLLQCHSLTLLTFHPAKKTGDEQDL